MLIKDPVVISAIENLIAAGIPYIGIFLAKTDTDSNLVSSTDQVEKIGVFAQITSTHRSGPEDSCLKVVVYPHRRIMINEITLPVFSMTVKEAVNGNGVEDVSLEKDDEGI